MAFVSDLEDAELILDTNKNTLTVKGAMSAVEEISEDSADAEYYDLTGVKVNEPGKGLYIVRRNGKTKKVMVK